MFAGGADERGGESGAQGRNRTSDTAIFSRMLYQLSYLGTVLVARAALIDKPGRAVHPARAPARQGVGPAFRG